MTFELYRSLTLVRPSLALASARGERRDHGVG